jgi:hypothetical protein
MFCRREIIESLRRVFTPPPPLDEEYKKRVFNNNARTAYWTSLAVPTARSSTTSRHTWQTSPPNTESTSASDTTHREDSMLRLAPHFIRCRRQLILDLVYDNEYTSIIDIYFCEFFPTFQTLSACAPKHLRHPV